MLQISPTEKPICSATIDQIRLRRATALPPAFQNASSSGRQSEIHVGLFVIANPFQSSPLRRCRLSLHMEARAEAWPRWRVTMLIDDVRDVVVGVGKGISISVP